MGTLLTAVNVADRLQISIRTAQRLMAKLEHIDVGLGERNRCLRITAETLEEYLAKCTVSPHSNVRIARTHEKKRIVTSNATGITSIPRR